MKIKFKFQVSQLNSLLHELDCLVHRKLNSKCAGDKSEVSCHQQKIDLEVEIHQTNLAYEQTELRLKQVDMEAKQNLDKLKDLRCQVCYMLHPKIEEGHPNNLLEQLFIRGKSLKRLCKLYTVK